MKNTMRVVSVAGLGLLGGIAIGAGPAQATGTTAQADSKPAAQQHIGRDDIVGYFRSPATCEIAGRIGERQGRWQYFDCDFEHVGLRGGGWVLRADRDRGWLHGHHGKPKPVKPVKPAKPADDGYGKPKGDKADDGYGKPKGDKADDGYGKPKADKADDKY